MEGRLRKAFEPMINLVAVRFRPLALFLFVLPLSFIVRCLFETYEWLTTSVFSRSHLHVDRVDRVCRQLVERSKDKVKKPMCTARAPWQNLSMRFSDYKKHSTCIYVGDMNQILCLDPVAKTLHVEPLAQVGQITRFLLKRGFMLATTLEIEEATIGGLAMAVGMTTASHKYGLLQETVEEYEIVLGDGALVHASRTTHPDLFYSLPWSHGSLGLLVGLTLKVIPVKEYVRVRYHRYEAMQGYTKKIRSLALEPVKSSADFVEATIFSVNSAIVMEGRFEDGPQVTGSSTPVNKLGRWYKPWFYKYVEGIAGSTNKEGLVHEELVPTYEYIFRHNRAIFWTIRDQFPEAVGNHPLFRFLFGWMFPPIVQFLKLPATPLIRHEMRHQRVYQDIVLPLGSLEDAIQLAEKTFGIFPILVYPSRIVDHGPGKRGLFPVPKEDQFIDSNRTTFPRTAMYFDLGVYGIPKKLRDAGKLHGNSAQDVGYDAIASARTFEQFTSSVSGAPFLYADTYMSRTEFEEMFNTELYEKVRTAYGAQGNFPHVYDKTSSMKQVKLD